MNRKSNSILILLIILAAFSSTFAQKTFTGFVLDARTGKTLPNANIQIENTYRGTITNNDGKYTLKIYKLPASIIVTYIGYNSKKISLTESSPSSLTIKLTPTVIQLKPITVSDEDPAVNIIRKIIRNKKRWLESLNTYQVDAYTRMSLSNDSGIVSIAESCSKMFWDKNKGSKEIIISRKESSNLTSNENFAFASNLQNLYDDNISVAGYNIVGVTNPKALKYYNFTLENYRSFNGKTLYDIRVTPKSKFQPLFKGRISVVDEDYAIIDVDLTPSDAILFPPPFKNFNIHYKQQFRNFGHIFWLPVDMRLEGGIKLGMVGLEIPEIKFSQISIFTDYKVNKVLPDTLVKSKKHILVDSLSIRTNRITEAPVPLTKEEDRAYQKLDSTMTLAKAFKPTGFLAKYVVVEAENDAASASTNSGNKKKKKSLFSIFKPRLQYNRVTGLGTGLRISKSFKRLKFSALSDYYFGLKRFAWSFSGTASIKNLKLTSSYFSGADTRYSSANFSRNINTAFALLGVTDYYDYFWNERWRTSISYKIPGITASLKLGFNSENHASLNETTAFTLLGKDKISRINPSINEGRLNSVSFNITLGHDFIPWAPIGQNRISIDIEHSSPDFLSSDFDFTNYKVQGDFRINTFLRRRMLPPALDVHFTAGTCKGVLPLQKIGIIETSIGGFMPFGVFKTLRNRPVEGEKYAALFAEHNFRTLPFEFLGLHSLARKGIGIIVFGGIGRTWMTDSIVNPNTYSPIELKKDYSEAGISINGILGIARVDFAVPLNRRGFYVGLGMARMF